MKVNQQEQTFIYSLQQPATTEQFFNDPYYQFYQQIVRQDLLP